MTHKEKAIELVESFAETIKPVTYGILIERDWVTAKQCALRAIDEILKSIVPKDDEERYAFELGGNQFYWQQVKKEIENF